MENRAAGGVHWPRKEEFRASVLSEILTSRSFELVGMDYRQRQMKRMPP